MTSASADKLCPPKTKRAGEKSGESEVNGKIINYETCLES